MYLRAGISSHSTQEAITKQQEATMKLVLYDKVESYKAPETHHRMINNCKLFCESSGTTTIDQLIYIQKKDKDDLIGILKKKVLVFNKEIQSINHFIFAQISIHRK